MCNIDIRRIIVLVFFTGFFFSLCNCNKFTTTSDDPPIPTFNSPVWHPDGNILGFNHIPISGSPAAGFNYHMDAAGFWLVNSDGTNMRRVLSFQLHNPCWSPDGKWIAFANAGVICKMPFDGFNFDTTRVYRLTYDNAEDFDPSWNTAGDTIYYDSDHDYDAVKPFQVFKMAADGSGQTLIGNKGIDSTFSRKPFYTDNGQILHIRGDEKSMYVFSMDTNGDNVRQLSDYTGSNRVIDNPVKYGPGIFYEDYGIWITDGSAPVKKIIDGSTQGFSISKNGTIAFVNFNNTASAIIDHSHGCIWTASYDGTNQRAFVLNNY
jgi:Tol biopolymer transport system component